MRADSYEHDILEAQRGQMVGIFECDGQMVFSDSFDFDAESIGSLSSPFGGQNAGDNKTKSWVNTDNFFRAWERLRSSNSFEGYDFVVKVDPDTVFIPQALRHYIAQHGIPADASLYFDNCPGVWNGFYGSIEVISKDAFGVFVQNIDQCKQTLQWQSWGEDLFAQKCMNSLGIMKQEAYDLAKDGNCHGHGMAPACSPGMAAYHPFKSVVEWQDCRGRATNTFATAGTNMQATAGWQ
eukprot:CAMPEP_0170267140 /NCGR_PEP_ID=MMETSP0116_2-20130129/33493_1 /TAXON_ID=400756 /ORGANISM="Durinskia baltica, Strain CSIRO CS-38" /LENGTH=237 /DNA_ID=CAMNT_0010518289 /DNA_START=25 /DNA_END=738 /DNA_ORIENTATION=-